MSTRSPLDGCHDGYCKIVGKATGQHTNAGCRCLKYPEQQAEFQKALASLKEFAVWVATMYDHHDDNDPKRCLYCRALEAYSYHDYGADE